MNTRPIHVFAVLLAGALLAPAGRAATLTADYQFNDSLASSVGSAPTLTYGATPSYADHTINAQTDRSLNFASGAGLFLDTAGLVAPASYSIAFLMKFDTGLAWRRMFDFTPTSDFGLYQDPSNQLNVWNPNGHPGTTLIPSGAFHTIVFTYDGAHTKVYLDGSPEIDAIANSQISGVGPAFPVTFFKDDAAENAPGSVARIQLYDGVLSAGDVASLDLTANTVPEPASLALLALAAPAFLRRRR